MTSPSAEAAPAPTIPPPVRLRIVCDGRPWALRVETEDGRLVDNVAAVRVDWGGRDSAYDRDGQPTAILTIVNIALDLAVVHPGYVRVDASSEPDCLCRHAIAQTPGQPTRHDPRCRLSPLRIASHQFVESRTTLDRCAYELPPLDDSDFRLCGEPRDRHVS